MLRISGHARGYLRIATLSEAQGPVRTTLASIMLAAGVMLGTVVPAGIAAAKDAPKSKGLSKCESEWAAKCKADKDCSSTEVTKLRSWLAGKCPDDRARDWLASCAEGATKTSGCYMLYKKGAKPKDEKADVLRCGLVSKAMLDGLAKGYAPLFEDGITEKKVDECPAEARYHYEKGRREIGPERASIAENWMPFSCSKHPLDDVSPKPGEYFPPHVWMPGYCYGVAKLGDSDYRCQAVAESAGKKGKDGRTMFARMDIIYFDAKDCPLSIKAKREKKIEDEKEEDKRREKAKKDCEINPFACPRSSGKSDKPESTITGIEEDLAKAALRTLDRIIPSAAAAPPPVERGGSPRSPGRAPAATGIPSGKSAKFGSTITGETEDAAKRKPLGDVTPTPESRKLSPPKGFKGYTEPPKAAPPPSAVAPPPSARAEVPSALTGGGRGVGGVSVDVKSKGEAEDLDRGDVLKLLRKPGS